MPVPENPSLDELLNDPVLKRAFMDYNATKQIEPDQIPFLQATEEYRKMAEDPTTSVQALSTKANQIVTQFVQADGGGVNIGGEMSKKLIKNAADLEKMAKGEIPVVKPGDRAIMMKAGEDEMRKLLKTNGVPRFLKTDQFQAAREQAEQVENAQAKYQKLEAKAEKLQNSGWERFKAFFNGGAEKQQKQILAEMEKTKMEILQKTDPERFETVQREKEKMVTKLDKKLDKLAPKVEQYQAMQQDPVMKDAVIKDSLDRGGMGSMSVKEKMANDKLVAKLRGAEGVVKATENIGQEKAELQKSVKTGETLKGKIGVPSQGQSGPKAGKL